MSSLGDPFQPNYREGFWSRWGRGLWRVIVSILAVAMMAVLGGLTLMLIYLVFKFLFWGAITVCVIFVLGLLGMGTEWSDWWD